MAALVRSRLCVHTKQMAKWSRRTSGLGSPGPALREKNLALDHPVTARRPSGGMVGENSSVCESKGPDTRPLHYRAPPGHSLSEALSAEASGCPVQKGVKFNTCKRNL
jgi:hypothetical protein